MTWASSRAGGSSSASGTSWTDAFLGGAWHTRHPPLQPGPLASWQAARFSLGHGGLSSIHVGSLSANELAPETRVSDLRSPSCDGSVVGLVPAAGTASRLGVRSGSKELLRVWRRPGTPTTEAEPVIRCLLAALEAAGAERALIVIRVGKDDIPAALGAASGDGMPLEYVRVSSSPSPPFTLDAAVPLIGDATVVLGLPDILFEPREAAGRVLERLVRTGADLALGLFPHPVIRRADVVELKADGTIGAVDRSGACVPGVLSWALAAWRASFTTFLHDFVAGIAAEDPRAGALGLGDVVNAAIAGGLAVTGEVVSDDTFLDVGTPEGLEEARRKQARG